MTQERQAVDPWLFLPVPSAALLLAPPPPLPGTQQPPSIDDLLPSSFFAPSLEPLFSLQHNQMDTNTELSLFSSFVFKTTTSRHSNKKKKASTERHRELPKKKHTQKNTLYKTKNLFQRKITDNISHIFFKNKQTANSEHFTSPLRYRVYYYYYYHFLLLWVV